MIEDFEFFFRCYRFADLVEACYEDPFIDFHHYYELSEKRVRFVDIDYLVIFERIPVFTT